MQVKYDARMMASRRISNSDSPNVCQACENVKMWNLLSTRGFYASREHIECKSLSSAWKTGTTSVRSCDDVISHNANWFILHHTRPMYFSSWLANW